MRGCEHKYKTKYIAQRLGFNEINDRKILKDTTMFICAQCGQITHISSVDLRVEIINGIRFTQVRKIGGILDNEHAHKMPRLINAYLKDNRFE